MNVNVRGVVQRACVCVCVCVYVVVDVWSTMSAAHSLVLDSSLLPFSPIESFALSSLEQQNVKMTKPARKLLHECVAKMVMVCIRAAARALGIRTRHEKRFRMSARVLFCVECAWSTVYVSIVFCFFFEVVCFGVREIVKRVLIV